MKLCSDKMGAVNRVLGSLTLALLLISCQSTETVGNSSTAANLIPSSVSSSQKTIFAHSRLNGHKAIKLNQTTYIANSENLGLFLFDDEQNIVASVTGNYEGLDVRVVNDTTYAISINKELGQTEVYSIKNTIFQLQHSIKLTHSRVSNVCFYQPNRNELQAILLTEDLRFEQRLVIDDLNNPAHFQLIRDISSPPHSSACAVDDKLGRLYLAEETNAIWAYPLNPEDEIQRQAVAMTKPFGNLDGEIKDLSILKDGRLLVSMPDMQSIMLLQQADDIWSMTSFSVSGQAIPESASLTLDGQLIWFDKEIDQYLSQLVMLPEYQEQSASQSIVNVMASGQTSPVNHFGDAADDPAIWPNRNTPAQSKILATDKSEGLYVYSLKGEIEQFIPTGRVNNVDISFGFDWQGKQVDLAAASNRTLNAIALYSIDMQGKVTEIGSIATDLPDVYGLCSYKSEQSEKHYVFINDESGTFQQYEITDDNGRIEGKMVRQFSVPSQPEGCVADSETATLYLGEEGKGIWKTTAEPYELSPELIIEIDKNVLFDDVEGLAIYKGKTKNYLVVSSQGNNSYVLYDLADLSLAGNFRVKANYQAGIDGTSETDGLAVSSVNFGGAYSAGLLVVQDGRNVMPSKPQNFKLISWSHIQMELSLTN